MQKFLLLFFLYIPALVFAGGQDDPPGAANAGMAHSSLATNDLWSAFNNPAGLGAVPSFAAGVFYQNKFMVKGLNYGGFAAAMPLGKGGLALTYTSFGYSAYQESEFGLAYGMQLSKTLSLGVKLNYQSLRIAEADYGQTGTLTADLGLSARVSENVTISAFLTNPTKSQLADFDDERLPTVLSVGVDYQIAENLCFSGLIAKDIDRKFDFRAGLEYQPVGPLYLRLGAGSEPQRFAFGLGVNFKDFKFDLAATYNTYLGYTPQISLTFAPDKK